MVWYKRGIVIVPMAVIAMVLLIAVPMAVVTSRNNKGTVSATTRFPPEGEETPPADYAGDRDVIDFNTSETEGTPAPADLYSDNADVWQELPRVDGSAALSDAPSDAPSVVPSDFPSTAPSTAPSDYPSIVPTAWGTPAPTLQEARFRTLETVAPTPVPSLDKAHLESDYPSIVPVGWDTPSPTTAGQIMDQSPSAERRQRRKLPPLPTDPPKAAPGSTPPPNMMRRNH